MKRQRGIYRRKGRDGWHGRVPVNGRLRQKRLGETYKEALTERKRIMEAGGLKPVVTVSQAVDSWISNQVAMRRSSERDRDMIAARAERHLTAFLGYDHVSRLDYERLTEYRLWLDGRGLSTRTVFHILSDLRSMLRWLDRTGRIARNPFDPALLPRVRDVIQRPYSEDEVADLCALPGELGFQLRLGFGSGMRFGDLCRLERSQHFDGSALTIVAEKTGRVVRVPMEPALALEIASRVGRLFLRSSGSSGSFNRTVQQKSGIIDFHAHGMRHTFAHRLRDRGLHMTDIQDLLGHASVITTERYLRRVVSQSVTESVTSIAKPLRTGTRHERS